LSETTVRTREADVSVLIVTWNSERWIGACLEALQGACGGLEWELIVVDNASADDSASMAERHGGARCRVIRSEENLGFAGGVNVGLEAVCGEWLLLLNPDCVLDPGSVPKLIEACGSEPNVVGAAPALRGVDGSSQARFQFRRLPTPGALVAETLFLDTVAPWNPATARYRYRERRDFTRQSDVEQPAFAAVLLSSRVVRREGPLDSAFHPAWFDDVDYCRRLCGSGYRLVAVPSATGVHAGGASLETLHRGEFAILWYRNMYRYARKWFASGGAEFVRWGIILGMMIRIVATAIGLGRFGADSRREVMRGWIETLKGAWSRWQADSRSS
jgi:GT2 family glycosyltransferase